MFDLDFRIYAATFEVGVAGNRDPLAEDGGVIFRAADGDTAAQVTAAANLYRTPDHGAVLDGCSFRQGEC